MGRFCCYFERDAPFTYDSFGEQIYGAVILMPKMSQRSLNSFFRVSSIRTLNMACVRVSIRLGLCFNTNLNIH